MEKTLAKTFENAELGKIRVIMIDNVPWFVGKDVAENLGYAKSENAIERHVDKEDKQLFQKPQNGVLEIDIPNRGLTIINESGLYSLILSSKLENAKKFKRWVTNEVLPSIRETGSYGTAPYVVIPKFFRGQQVITIKDAAAILNVTRGMIEEVINKPTANIREGRDYYRLKGDERAEFKRDNPSIAYCVHHIIAILESGFKRLCNYFQVKNVPQVFFKKANELALEMQELKRQVIKGTMLIDENNIAEEKKVQDFLLKEYHEMNSKMGDIAYAKTFGRFRQPLVDAVNYLGYKMFSKAAGISPIVSAK